MTDRDRVRPDCDICGRPYGRHHEIVGAGRMCPVSAVSYRPKRAATSSPCVDMEQRARELLAAEYPEMRADIIAGKTVGLTSATALRAITAALAINARIEKALSLPSTAREAAKDEWRCINCKLVIESATEPQQCGQCRGWAFAHIWKPPAKSAREEVDADKLSQASIVLHQQGHHDLGEYLDSLWNPQ